MTLGASSVLRIVLQPQAQIRRAATDAGVWVPGKSERLSIVRLLPFAPVRRRADSATPSTRGSRATPSSAGARQHAHTDRLRRQREHVGRTVMRRGVHALTVHQQVQIRIAGHAIDAEGELAGAAGEAEVGQLVSAGCAVRTGQADVAAGQADRPAGRALLRHVTGLLKRNGSGRGTGIDQNLSGVDARCPMPIRNDVVVEGRRSERSHRCHFRCFGRRWPTVGRTNAPGLPHGPRSAGAERRPAGGCSA